MVAAAVISSAAVLINPAGRKINSGCDRTMTEMNSFLTTDEAKLAVRSRVVVAKVHFLSPPLPALRRINHNERLEFLGDAVVEFLTR